jgi:hypothetical protein
MRRVNQQLAPLLRPAEAGTEFLWLLRSIRVRLTTSHAVAELHHLQRSRLQLSGEELNNFWNAGIDLLKSWGLDERLVRLLDIANRAELLGRIPEIGLVDTGLIELARQNGCMLITEDERTLTPLALRLGIDCRLVQQLIG